MKPLTFLTAVFISLITVFIYIELTATTASTTDTHSSASKNNVQLIKFGNEDNQNESGDFTTATSVADAVVHVRGKRKEYNYFNSGYNEKNVAGSGVIINSGGFIITNNHVIKNASGLTVTLANRKTYKASLVGVDADNDLALLKINEHNLPVISFANSDVIHVGDWVLAIGYPWNLDETITAGIVSAKSATSDRGTKTYSVNSFIQTDAAINLGNSGGALVNTNGELIGINTALVSPTATYTGYGYAIPANTVRRVVENILKKTPGIKTSF